MNSLFMRSTTSMLISSQPRPVLSSLQTSFAQDNIRSQKLSAHKAPICPRELEAIRGSQPYFFRSRSPETGIHHEYMNKDIKSVCKLSFTMISIDSITRQEVRGPTLHTMLNFLVDFPGVDVAQVLKHVQYRPGNFFLSESLKGKGPSIFRL